MLDKELLKTFFTVRRCTAPGLDDLRETLPRKFYGPIHGSDDCDETSCGMPIKNSKYHWYILNNTYDGEITCRRCLEAIRRDLEERFKPLKGDS